MQWPWRKSPKYPENRATLTFLANGVTVLGLPHDVPMDLAEAAMRHLREWNESGAPPRTFVFPFPVDVVDLRR